MSRPLRLQYPGAWYHVMNRGRRREKIVCSKKDCQDFVTILEQASSLFHVQVSAWCLVTNHYHLLVSTPDGNLSRFMRHVDGIYTQHFNRTYSCDGQLFRGRYKSILIDSEHETYVMELIRYIHRNPLKAGLEEELGQYPWSSWSAYTTRQKKWKWVDTESILSRFPGNRRDRVAAFRHLVHGETDEEITAIMESSRFPLALGTDRFLNWLKETFFEEKHNQIPQSRFLAPPRTTIITSVRTYYKCRESELYKSQRGVTNEPRNVTMYLMRELRGEPLLQIGKLFGLSQYSSVSSIVTKVRTQLKKDNTLLQRVQEIIHMIRKGQT